MSKPNAAGTRADAELRAVEQLAEQAERFTRSVEASAELDIELLGGMESDIWRRLAELDQIGELARRTASKLRRDVAAIRGQALQSADTSDDTTRDTSADKADSRN
ncbi:hypothetical protein [Planctomycetes bacterium TBK1r]|uniref:Uncharacterized protein n=1 Tax=Stieleria magnilauensis TaxID=2527963 RepID=A0ABX5XXN3_9BACT|nr:hypothetical protein TBK1r_50790 [Planctomycetes bacterium TBK1r]